MGGRQEATAFASVVCYGKAAGCTPFCRRRRSRVEPRRLGGGTMYVDASKAFEVGVPFAWVA